MEQCCDIDYVNQGQLTQQKAKQINQTIEDLLFVGSELIGIGYSIFTNEYEQKIENKHQWIEANKSLVCEHFLRKNPELKADPVFLTVKSLFIINTPTFYMHIGKVNHLLF